MAGYKEPGIQDRVNAAAQARAKALQLLKSKPPIDPAVQAERIARAAEREAAQAAKREAAKAAREAKIAEKAAQAEKARQEAAAAAPPPPLTEAEKKAARDARYAARKARKK
ncbi:MAG TPA: DUF6481 family protein [Novosphingobium sp.]|nr:DUF6481 family protein [Novosphingobium sp.]